MSKEVKQTIFVNGVIRNRDQQVLLVRRAKDDKFLPGYYELPGGRVSLGEDLEDALKRKLIKEVGIDPSGAVYFMSMAQINRQGPYVRVAFEIVHAGNHEDIQLSAAHDEYVWVDRKHLNKEKITSDAQAILEKYLGENHSESNDVKKSTITIYTDGGSRGNPGPSASAYVIYDETDKIIEAGGAYIGITTNNQAEYNAVLLALKAVKQFADKNTTLTLNIDSLLVVNQMNGVYKIKNRELWPIYQEIRQLSTDFAGVTFRHISRENNTAADAKVNEILDAHQE